MGMVGHWGYWLCIDIAISWLHTVVQLKMAQASFWCCSGLTKAGSVTILLSEHLFVVLVWIQVSNLVG